MTTGGLTTGDGRQDRYLRSIGDLSLEPVLEADVLAADVDVDEAAQVAVLGDPVAQRAVRLEDRVEDLADRRTADLQLGLAVGGGAQLGRDLHGDCHQTVTS